MNTTKAQAERLEKVVKFNVEVEVKSLGDQRLSIMSSFSSAFDGFELIVLDKAGKEVARRLYVAHQSPSYIDGRKFTLEEMNVKEDLTFFVSGIPENSNEVGIKLDGGDRYADAISSPVFHVVIE